MTIMERHDHCRKAVSVKTAFKKKVKNTFKKNNNNLKNL